MSRASDHEKAEALEEVVPVCSVAVLSPAKLVGGDSVASRLAFGSSRGVSDKRFRLRGGPGNPLAGAHLGLGLVLSLIHI